MTFVTFLVEVTSLKTLWIIYDDCSAHVQVVASVSCNMSSTKNDNLFLQTVSQFYFVYKAG